MFEVGRREVGPLEIKQRREPAAIPEQVDDMHIAPCTNPAHCLMNAVTRSAMKALTSSRTPRSTPGIWDTAVNKRPASSGGA